MKESIKKELQQTLKDQFHYQIDLEKIQIHPPKHPDHGDLATNIALQLAKELQQPPRELANTLTQNIQNKLPQIEKIIIEGPGFINFFLAKTYRYRILASTQEDWDRIFSYKICQSLGQEKIQHTLQSMSKELQEIRYVHSRIFSILKRLQEEGIGIGTSEEIEYEESEIEQNLLDWMNHYGEIVDKALQKREPSIILSYLMDLSTYFFKLHENTLFRQQTPKRREGTLRILYTMNLILRNGLEGLGQEAPQKM